MDVIHVLEGLGYKTVGDGWYAHVGEWRRWYEGNVKEFHDYRVWNGQRHVSCRRYTLGMAKKVCEDWANLLMNEKVKITLEGDPEQQFIDEVFAANNFEIAMNELQERGAAAGTYAIIPRVTKGAVNERGEILPGGDIVLDYVTAEHIFPLAWSGREIKECAFASVYNSDGKKYLYLQIHVQDERGEYEIHNRIYDATNDGMGEVSFADVKGLESVPDTPILTRSNRPQFVIGRYNIVNNIDENNPMGISIYANALDQIKAVDIAYDSYVNEFVLGKKRIMVQPSATKNIDGESVFDPSDVTYYVLPEDVSDGSLIHEINMALRVSEHNRGVQDQLNLLSAKCGFGEQHYKFDGGNVATATQIISENSTLFRSVKKHEIVLEKLIIDLCRTLLRMGKDYLGLSLNEDVEISVDFDDSIIEDRSRDEARVYQMLSAGLMRPEEARALLMNEDEETARAALPTMVDLVGGEVQQEVE